MPTSSPAERKTLRWFARRMVSFVSWILASDHLPPAPRDETRRRFSRGFAARRESRTPLSSIATTAPIGNRFFSWLFSAESLPARSTPAEPVVGSFARWLLTGEHLEPAPSIEPKEGDLES